MYYIGEHNQIIEQAKRRRAEVIASGLRSYALPIVAVASLSFATVQFASDDETTPLVQVQTAQVG